MFILKKFLFCIKLETGAYIIGCIHLITQALLFLFSVAYLTVYNCKNFEKFFHFADNRICMFERDFIAFAWMVMITTLGLTFFCYYNGIMGIKQANFSRVDPFMKWLAIFAICSMYDLVYLTVQGTIFALIKGAINGYFFFVFYSLYITWRDGLPQYKVAPQN